MNLTAFLMLLGLVGTVCLHPICPEDCTSTSTSASEHHKQYFKHVSDLGNSSAAPWQMIKHYDPDREPQHIHYASCKNCNIGGMIAKPIYFQIAVYQRASNSTNSWCRCPYQLAVGCTCVQE